MEEDYISGHDATAAVSVFLERWDWFGNKAVAKMTDGEKSDARFELILKAIEDRDANAITALFSKKALEDATDIDASVEYLFNLFDEEVVSWEKDTLSSGESVRNGKKVD